MTSHIYVAEGYISDVRVMKIGKANNLKARQKQLSIAMKFARACNSDREAFALEAHLRNFWSRKGCRPFGSTNDYYLYDQQAYDAMYSYASGMRDDETAIAELGETLRVIVELRKNVVQLHSDRLNDRVEFYGALL